jgi:tetratricopeptide (TPR) repeat protein
LPGSLRLGALLIALLPACGLLSRDEFIRRDLHPEIEPETLTELRGIQPMNTGLWMFSAFVSGAESAEETLELIDRGLEFHPADPHLRRAHVQLVGEASGPQAQIDAAQEALGTGRAAGLEVELRMFTVEGHLRLDDPMQAAEETLRLGAVRGVDPALVSLNWARIAVTHEFLGQSDEADGAIDRSIDMGPAGVNSLTIETQRAPERIAAVRNLAQRAAQRHPRNPDLALFLTVDLLLQGDTEAAEQALEDLPGPLPWRLQSATTVLLARIRLEQERVDEALGLIGDWLDRYPRDTTAVHVLLEIWSGIGRPDDATMIARLRASRSRLHPPGLANRIEQVLKLLEERAPVEDGAD